MKQWDFDLVALHGPQEMTAEDRSYRGSRYADVRKALYANPYRGGASGQEPGPLPMFRSTIRNVCFADFRLAEQARGILRSIIRIDGSPRKSAPAPGRDGI